ncbi:MAG: mRNA 3-end processing factor [Candidatus Micrarchaeota archaeon]|nr:MAG: mRNA 3-end processing factor [Candidatus Micrarchaeota archaeon]
MTRSLISIDGSTDIYSIMFVSHAHADHIRYIESRAKIISSERTYDLASARRRLKAERFIPRNIELLPAGHILGSTQLLLHNYAMGLDIIYSGDFNLASNPVAEKIIIKEADVLIIDSTYYDPSIRFEDREDVYERIIEFVESKRDSFIVFRSYSLGKAQELIYIMNKAGIVPYVDSNIAKINEVYNKNGFCLRYQHIDLKDLEPNVIIYSKLNVDILKSYIKIRYNKDVYTAVATGMIYRYGLMRNDYGFGLSDHADFYQAIDYINSVNPRLILTYGNDKVKFARYLKAYGYNAIPFSEIYYSYLVADD